MAVDIVGLEPCHSELARGIVIARARAPLSADAQRALWKALEAAGVTESSEDEADDGEPPDDESRQWLAAPWLPPTASELTAQRDALEAAAQQWELDAIWCVKVETGVDAVMWLERIANGDIETETELEAAAEEAVEAVAEQPTGEVLYAAPDAPVATPALAETAEEAGDDDPDEADDADDDDVDDSSGEVTEAIVVESMWRNGPPPLEAAVAFPLEGYPDAIDEFDADAFGIAFKLTGPALPGEEAIVNAFFALWLSVYQDERAEQFEPFQRADVVHDREHRSALMWVEKLAVPATASDQVAFLMWIVARIHDIVPIAWARFDDVDDAIKARATGDGGEQALILAGNPFADRFRRLGEQAALAWAVGQTGWSKRELAGMLVEVALQHDPDARSTAAIAERLLRRALDFDPGSDATGYLAIVLVRQNRAVEAIELARAAPGLDVRTLVIGDAAEHAPDAVPAALELLDDATARALIARGGAEELADLIAAIARHAPDHLALALARLPPDPTLVPHLYNASFSVERRAALAILRTVLALPPPERDAGEARTALVMAWNNACIHAHALGEYQLARELADGGQPFAAENPYIYHSAACAYAATGDIDRALEQVSRAIDRNYEHSEKMETDADLAPLRRDPRFSHLFTEWRARRADLN